MSSVDVLIQSAGTSGTVPAESHGTPRSLQLRGLRFFHTARHFRARQIVHRVSSVLRRRLCGRRLVERFAPATVVDVSIPDGVLSIARRKLVQRRDDARTAGRAASIREGKWTFLGQSLTLGTVPDWRSTRLREAPRLWQFHLQYHEWLLDLAVDSESPTELWDHVQRWMETFSGCTERQAGDAWHPYCISRRLPAWIDLWAVVPPPPEIRAEIAGSIASQAAYLERRLEIDLGGNHLLENARSLIVAGAALRNADGDRWLDRGAQIVESQLPEQVLPHGEHFERSPMYHCLMTEALEDMRDATRALRPEFSARCARTVEEMHEFTAAIRHPDGDIPLLGDSALDEAPSSHQPVAQPRPEGARRIGDYWTFRTGGDFLLFDAGLVGPDHLPAHAHADLLSIEASFDGQRFIVDSGVHDYEDGEMRRYCRSTAAHNVLEIDGQNQCDVYSRFRMGRRGWPTSFRCGEENGVAWATATHNAYRHLGVHTVTRSISCCLDEGWMTITDNAMGRGPHALVSRLHLHPEVHVTSLPGSALQLERNGVVRFLILLGRGELTLATGWYCPRFGERIANTVIEARLNSQLPAALSWRMTEAHPAVATEAMAEIARAV